MTRLAIVGSSHTGALRQAEAAIRENRPDLEIAWFGLPGAPFRRVKVNRHGVLRLDPVDASQRPLVRRINGSARFDLNDRDLIWVVGNRFGMGRITTLFLHYDVLGMARTGRPQVISRPFLEAAITAEVETSCTRLETQFGTDRTLVVTPAPYPAEAACAPGPGHEPPLANIYAHPDGPEIMALFHAAIRAGLTARGWGVVLQPEATLAGPFATKSAYLSGARDFRDPRRTIDDCRHMNADYGLAQFRAFAELHLCGGSTIGDTQDSRKDH